MPLLQLQSGFKSYGPKVLFEEAGFAINEGEHVGVIGPNGAGKTTLFKILVGHFCLPWFTSSTPCAPSRCIVALVPKIVKDVTESPSCQYEAAPLDMISSYI